MHHKLIVCKLTTILLFLLAFGGLYIAPAFAADWPQFQGPDRSGVSSEKGLARTWPEGGPTELWSTNLGEGFSGAAVKDGEVFVVDRNGELEDMLRVYSLDSGKELWNFSYDAPGKVSYHGSRTTPTVTDTHVFFVGVMGDFYCIDRDTKKPVWNKNLVKDFKLKRLPGWGICQAPILHNDLVIVAPQSAEASIAAFNQITGKLVWKAPQIGRLAYTTPIIRKIHGVDQAIMAFANSRVDPGNVAGFSLENGKVLWEYTGWENKIPIPFPTVLPDNRVFITGGYDSGSVMIEVTKSGRKFKTKELWKNKNLGSQIHQPLVVGDHFYMNNNENSRKDGMSCVSFDGAVKWKTKDTEGLPWFDLGNMILVDGLILNMDGRTGMLHLIEPSTGEYKELASAQVLDNKKKKYWAPMAYSNGKLLVRSQETLHCLDLRKW